MVLLYYMKKIEKVEEEIKRKQEGKEDYERHIRKKKESEEIHEERKRMTIKLKVERTIKVEDGKFKLIKTTTLGSCQPQVEIEFETESVSEAMYLLQLLKEENQYFEQWIKNTFTKKPEYKLSTAPELFPEWKL
jgi:hypothetical protein